MNDDGKTVKIDVSGTCSINSSCLSGTFNYTTLKSIALEHSKICPSDGVLKITGTSDMTMTYTSTGGIQIDNRSDGTIDYVFASCQEARICKQ